MTIFILQLTVLNAGRKYLGLNDLSGKVFLTSGLGGMDIKFIFQLRRFIFRTFLNSSIITGMSGAQAKAATISGCIGIVAEVQFPIFPFAANSFCQLFSLNNNNKI